MVIGGPLTEQRQAAAGAARRVGRGLVWLALAVVVIRGVAAIASQPQTPARTARTPVATGNWSPSPAMLWVAEAFVRDWLSDSPRRQAAAAGLESSQASIAAPTLGARAWTVLATTPVGWRRTEAASAQITVDARLRVGGQMRERFVVVPVAASSSGVAVIAAPAMGASPAIDRGLPAAADEGATPAPAAVGGLLGQFFRAYFSGADLTYFTVPGRAVGHPPAGLELRSVQSVQRLLAAGPDALRVQAAVTVQDERTEDTYPLVYGLTVRRLGRWVVANINQ